MLSLFNDFVKSVDSNKSRLIYKRVNKSVATLMRTYLLTDKKENIKGEIISFDSTIKSLSTIFYDETQKDWFFVSLRLWNYALVPMIKILYKVWCLKYE